MAKKKSQKKFSSSNENPFNIKVNRSKHSVLGQKLKGTRGLPGVSHSVGNAKRKEEFHKKRLLSRKANRFLDKRLMDNSLSYEEQATLRLVEERKRKLKKNIFNLNDDESLTHKGLPLDQQKSLNDRLNDSDDDEQLDPKFVKQAHFGGFAGESSTEQKSRKEIIDELIAESKKRKVEKKMEREKNEDLIEKLDQKWKEMHHSLPVMKGKKQITTTTSEKKDPFDIMLQELKYEMRATPIGPVKTPEEIAKEENEKIKQLEEEQLRRMMNPMDDVETKNNLLSADSIYDGLDIQFEPINDQEVENINANADKNSEDDESSDDSSGDSEDENDVKDNIEENENTLITMSVDGDSDVPVSLEVFQNIVDNQTEELHVIVESILKGKIKSKSKKNVEKFEMFFGVLLEYVMQSNVNSSKTLEILDKILPSLYSLAETSPVNTAGKLLALLDKEQDMFQQSKGKKLKKNFPRFQSLVLFKVISSIYSVSDFKHPVVTPAIVFMCDILSSAFTVSYQNTCARLFISKIIYDCVSLSKRYVPEILWFLDKMLELAINNSKKFNLFIDEPVTDEIRMDVSFEIADKSLNNVIKASVIFEVTELLSKFASLYVQLQCYKEIFSTSLSIAKRLPTHNYPDFLKESISKFVAAIENQKKTYKPLMFESKKPVPLKMFEPAFDSKFTRKKDDIQKKRKLIKNVNQKIRKEEKCLLREARRDNQVVASEKLKEKLEADEERKRKVKQLYSELAVQEGEYKKFMKKKK